VDKYGYLPGSDQPDYQLGSRKLYNDVEECIEACADLATCGFFTADGQYCSFKHTYNPAWAVADAKYDTYIGEQTVHPPAQDTAARFIVWRPAAIARGLSTPEPPAPLQGPCTASSTTA
jgi:hypothetical protein